MPARNNYLSGGPVVVLTPLEKRLSFLMGLMLLHVLGFNGQLFAEQREPNSPKAESANVTREASPVLDEKQVEAIVRRILAERQRPEPLSSGARAERPEPNTPKTEMVSATKEASPVLDEKQIGGNSQKDTRRTAESGAEAIGCPCFLERRSLF